jgi:NADH-quinone oxidoreductase subunit J
MNIVFLSIVLILAIVSLNTKKSINALISFALMMLVLGVYYIYLEEKLLGLFQIFIYTGGISVLMLFGITLIGTDFPKTKANPWTALGAFLFFVLLSTLFLTNNSHLIVQNSTIIEPKELFSSSFSDVVIIFALIASSLLYGTIKVIKTLNPKKEKDV